MKECGCEFNQGGCIKKGYGTWYTAKEKKQTHGLGFRVPWTLHPKSVEDGPGKRFSFDRFEAG